MSCGIMSKINLLTFSCTRFSYSHFLIDNFTFHPASLIGPNQYMLRRMVRQVVTDWDETVTKVDTIQFLAEACYHKKPNYRPPFSYFSNVYRAALDKFNADEKMAATLSELHYQQKMRSVEQASISEIERLKLFQGLTREDFQAVAEKVEIQGGFIPFLSSCRKLNIPVTILSVNWSKITIEEVLRRNGVDPSTIQILVNEFEFDDAGICTGKFDRSVSIRTGSDKVDLVKSLLADNDFMYIGDSRTDLLSILQSRVGVIFNKESTRAKAVSMGVEVKERGDGSDKGPVVYYARSWSDVADLLKV